MGSRRRKNSSPSSSSNSPSSSRGIDMSISELREKHQNDVENLSLSMQPLRTTKLFVLAVVLYIKCSATYLLAKGGWLMLLSTVALALGILLMTIDGPHEKHVEELVKYFRFGLWWMALGVASSIGLGSGLHTFVLYLGPHIALFTIKAVQCGRVDLKSAPYDTILLKRGPTWLDKECSDFGPPLLPKLTHGFRVPLSSILPQVQVEAILWGIGTAIGELPPYFISRAASMSGDKVNPIEELDDSDQGSGFLATHMNQIKRWLLTHSQHMNFLTILILASVPNPLFDLAGIMCGQFGIPFWKFFLATLIGKAIIKTHIQTFFIIGVCNNQLLNWIENEFIWVLSFIPGFASAIPKVIAKLNAVKEKYVSSAPVSSNIKVKTWDFSFSSIWSTVVWLMLINFFAKIVNATAQRYLKKQQEAEIAALTQNS